MRGLQRELFSGDLLVRRLHTLGLSGVRHIEYHENRAVIVSLTDRGILRVHRCFAYAPDVVLRDIVAFVDPRTRSARRRSARRAILDFPVEAFVQTARPRPRRRPVVRREDRPLLMRMSKLHGELNGRCFGGSLGKIKFRVSRRMRRKLGEIALDPSTERPLEISISYAHIARDGWREVEHTLLHEMIHQWQAESSLAVDHGAIFRAKAREVGIEPRAMRDVGHKTAHNED